MWLNEWKPYTAKSGYKWLTNHKDSMNWHHWVWNSINILKHSIIAWLVALGKLNTRERLVKVEVCTDDNCLVCTQGVDSCHHLFFRCRSGKAICDGIMMWLGISLGPDASIHTMWKRRGRKYSNRKKQKVYIRLLQPMCILFGRPKTTTTGMMVCLELIM